MGICDNFFPFSEKCFAKKKSLIFPLAINHSMEYSKKSLVVFDVVIGIFQYEWSDSLDFWEYFA
jgi:hypothetical protein